jgi:hypothetical protein
LVALAIAARIRLLALAAGYAIAKAKANSLRWIRGVASHRELHVYLQQLIGYLALRQRTCPQRRRARYTVRPSLFLRGTKKV